MVANKKSIAHRGKGKRIAAEKKAPSKPHAIAPSGATVTIDRREIHERRLGADRRSQNLPVAVEHRALERRVKVNRRRQIDPTTCERDYTPDEIEFMGAMDQYKRHNGRMFPTCSEILEVIKTLGYEKRPKIEAVALPVFDLSAVSASVATPVG
jgi:hypothetical protein